MLQHYQGDLFLYSHGTQSHPWSHCKSAGNPIKASTEHHCSGLTLTTSYTNLFFLPLNITSATHLKNCFKLPHVSLHFFPLCWFYYFSVIPQLLLRTVIQDIFECLWCTFPFMGATTKKPEAGRLSAISFFWPVENILKCGGSICGWNIAKFHINTGSITGPSGVPPPIK